VNVLIALLVALGVNLIVIVAIVAIVVGHKRWLMRRPGAFRGAIRVTSGAVDGLRPKWSRGVGRWANDVLVWTKGPLLFRTELLATHGAEEERPAGNDEVKHLGDHPSVIRLTVGRATLDVAAASDHREMLVGPDRTSGSAPAQ
jgi:hypothetical protein